MTILESTVVNFVGTPVYPCLSGFVYPCLSGFECQVTCFPNQRTESHNVALLSRMPITDASGPVSGSPGKTWCKTASIPRFLVYKTCEVPNHCSLATRPRRNATGKDMACSCFAEVMLLSLPFFRFPPPPEPVNVPCKAWRMQHHPWHFVDRKKPSTASTRLHVFTAALMPMVRSLWRNRI